MSGREFVSCWNADAIVDVTSVLGNYSWDQNSVSQSDEL